MPGSSPDNDVEVVRFAMLVWVLSLRSFLLLQKKKSKQAAQKVEQKAEKKAKKKEREDDSDDNEEMPVAKKQKNDRRWDVCFCVLIDADVTE